jgi:hypothetical protein
MEQALATQHRDNLAFQHDLLLANQTFQANLLNVIITIQQNAANHMSMTRPMDIPTAPKEPLSAGNPNLPSTETGIDSCQSHPSGHAPTPRHPQLDPQTTSRHLVSALPQPTPLLPCIPTSSLPPIPTTSCSPPSLQPCPPPTLIPIPALPSSDPSSHPQMCPPPLHILIQLLILFLTILSGFHFSRLRPRSWDRTHWPPSFL